MMILIINKNHHEYDVFDDLTVENVTAVKTCFRLMSDINKQKFASSTWDFLKPQITKYVKQSKKYFKIWLKRFRYDPPLSMKKKNYVFFELTAVSSNKITKNRKMRKQNMINYDFWNFDEFVTMNIDSVSAFAQNKKSISLTIRNQNENLLLQTTQSKIN